MTDSDSKRHHSDPGTSLPTGVVTWTTLLARWIALVKAGEGLVLAAPGDSDARRWRSSIPEVVTLQSVTFALGDLERLPEADRSLARDRADLAVTESSARLDRLWRGENMPEGLLEVAADARRAVDLAVYIGLRWLVNAGEGLWRMPEVDLDADGPAGTLALMQPGTLATPGSPVAWWTERPLPPGLEAELEENDGPLRIAAGPPVQVYRDLDENGRFIADLVETLEALPPGLPLLVPIALDGESIGRFTVESATWAKANDAALEGIADGTRAGFGDFEHSSPE
ncbi:MAG: hypothetical protein GY895_18060 [Phycisphaera sp.]|nr:hypothetical protein [Phycisphaera sp.]